MKTNPMADIGNDGENKGKRQIRFCDGEQRCFGGEDENDQARLDLVEGRDQGILNPHPYKPVHCSVFRFAATETSTMRHCGLKLA